MGKIMNTIFTRPYHFWKYVFQTTGICINYLFLSVQKNFQKNIKIGKNARVLSFNAFKAEKPNASIHIGDSIIVYKNCDILATDSGMIEIGNECIIGSNFRMYCKQKIQLGDHVIISWDVFIQDYDGHSTEPNERLNEVKYIHETFIPNFSVKKKDVNVHSYIPRYVSKPIIIGNNVWIGANAVIVKGVTIGDGSIIAAGAIVTKNIPENCIAAGNPAMVVKKVSVIDNPLGS